MYEILIIKPISFLCSRVIGILCTVFSWCLLLILTVLVQIKSLLNVWNLGHQAYFSSMFPCSVIMSTISYWDFIYCFFTDDCFLVPGEENCRTCYAWCGWKIRESKVSDCKLQAFFCYGIVYLHFFIKLFPLLSKALIDYNLYLMYMQFC